MSFNPETIRDWQGKIIGFRCSICDEIKTKMWGNICNLCRAKGYDK